MFYTLHRKVEREKMELSPKDSLQSLVCKLSGKRKQETAIELAYYSIARIFLTTLKKMLWAAVLVTLPSVHS